MKLTITLLIALLFGCHFAMGQTVPKSDSVSIKGIDTAGKKKAVKPPYLHQLRFGVDLLRIGSNMLYSWKQGYEFEADYKLRKANYLVFETGFGKNKVDYDQLHYSNSNGFIKLGVDKNVLDVISPKDYDMFFIGVRYGMAFGKRSDATFTVPSYFGPPTEGSNKGQGYLLQWGEINAGLRVELLKNLFVGWNVRLKFLFNAGAFKELAPSYVPGYGAGDNATNLGANIYICYALRWMGK